MVFNLLKRQGFESSYQNYRLIQAREAVVSDSTPDSLRVKELQRIMEQAINRLPPQQQRAFRLSRESGLTHEQIALEMGVGAPSVKDYIVRALAFLRTYLKEVGEMVCLFLFCK
jgi:RNA polymerase sigma-70 factor (ECF subfamily)